MASHYKRWSEKEDEFLLGNHKEKELNTALSCLTELQAHALKELTTYTRGRQKKMNKFQIGDTIKCYNKDELVKIMTALEKENIHTDFLYEKDGHKGLWLIVEGIG